MAKILIWNSIAKRRRSLSDTFYDNGIGTIKGYLEDRGHEVEVVDWANGAFFQSLSPMFMAKLLRRIYSVMIKQKDKRIRKLLGMLSLMLQEAMGVVQEARLKKHIKDLVSRIRREKIRLVGVKIWYGDAFKNAKYLAKELKRVSPETLVIAGGYHVTLYEENILKFSDFDLGVACEGEFALEEILKIAGKYGNDWRKDEVLQEIIKLAEDAKIENLIYRKGSDIHKTKRKYDLENTVKTIPRYDISENKVRIHVMVESLGCTWGKCNFCVHPQFYPRYMLMDTDSLVGQVEAMVKNGIGVFRFAGSDTPPAVGAKIAQKFLDSKLKIIFGMGSRAIRGADKMYDNLVSHYTVLIRAGLRSVFMGGECGNDFINDEVMNKGVNSGDIINTVKALREAEKITGEKIYLSLALIYPPPLLGKVKLEDVMEDNLRLLRQTMPDSVMITPPGPFLHTKWNEERQKFGFALEDGIVKQAMEYEYVLYKPPHLWPKFGISLEGRPFKKLLEECGQFREKVEKELDIPTDISDEHFLMFYAAGFRDKERIKEVKTETMLDVVSCDYTKTEEISRKVNEYSQKLASSNVIVG